MTNKKEIAGKVMTAFYRSCLGKKPTFQDDKIAVAAALRELVKQLKYIGITEKNILEIVRELENL